MAKRQGIKWNMRGINRLKRLMKGDQHLNLLMLDIGKLYLSFTQRRYTKFSRGGGDWRALAEATKRQRRGDGARAAILRDTGLLLSALAPGATGNQLRIIRRGVVRAGYSESARHEGTNMTFAELAKIHQIGNNNLPARPIFVGPDDATKRRMLLLIGKVMAKRGAV